VVETNQEDRLVGIGDREDPAVPRDGGAREPARIARAVEPLAVLHDDRAERRQRGRLLQDALGDVRLHPHALPLARAERTRLVQDGVRDPQPAKPVEQTRMAQRADLCCRHPELDAGRSGELRDGLAVPERVR
jgi:hypothetical protein